MPGHLTLASNTLEDGLVQSLAERGWACAPAFVPQPIWNQLAVELRAAAAAGRLRPAAVGAGARRQLAAEVRGDDILWIDASTAAQRDVLRRLERLRLACNRELQLGLFEFEGHFARYPVGAFYRRHRDQHLDSDARVLSCAVYLNPNWNAQDGGQLRLHLQPGDPLPFVDVPPSGGTLLCFLSARFFHEVLQARRERLSLTGWFRRRSET